MKAVKIKCGLQLGSKCGLQAASRDINVPSPFPDLSIELQSFPPLMHVRSVISLLLTALSKQARNPWQPCQATPELPVVSALLCASHPRLSRSRRVTKKCWKYSCPFSESKQGSSSRFPTTTTPHSFQQCAIARLAHHTHHDRLE